MESDKTARLGKTSDTRNWIVDIAILLWIFLLVTMFGAYQYIE
jgi:hypothetical protein